MASLSESTKNEQAGLCGAALGAADGAGALPPSAFDPTSLGLRADFRLTDFSKLKG